MGRREFTENEEMYYCSKNVCFPKTEVFRLILEIFDESGKNELREEEIYAGLQSRLGVVHVNKENLLRLLGGSEAVKRTEVSAMYQARVYASSGKESSGRTADRCPSAAGIKKTVEDLGFDFLTGYLATDGVCFENFRRAMINPGKPYYPVRRVDRPWSGEVLLEFIRSAGEGPFRALLDDQETFENAYRCFSREYGKRKAAEKFLAGFRAMAEKVCRENAGCAVRYLVPEKVAETFGILGVRTVRDLILLADRDVERLCPSEETVFALLNMLQTPLQDLLTDMFRDMLSMQKRKGVPHRLWERYAGMIECRVNGMTLEATGRRFGVTRERVRQLEVKYFKAFEAFCEGNDMLRGLMRSLSGNGNYCTLDEIRRFVKFKPDILIHLLKKAGPEDIVFSEPAGLFAFTAGTDWLNELSAAAAALPDILGDEAMNAEIAAAAERLREKGCDIPEGICRKILCEGYRRPGAIYTRSHMPLGERYNLILRENFPDGMHVYDKKEMDKFRRCYKKVFKDGKISENDRAMGSRIMDGAVLCGRGIYKPRQERYVSDELLRDMYDYIMNSDKEIFVTNTLFYVFEDRLRAEGVDNKYYMQGILGECFKDKSLYFKRDYISRNKDITSVYDSLVEFVRKARRSVTKAEIKAEFPGISEVIIAMACRSADGIANGFATYTHLDTLLEKKKAVRALDRVIGKTVSDGNIHSCKDLSARLRIEAPFVLDDFGIENAYKLFSVMQLLFADRYEMRRPFFAAKGVSIGHQTDRIREFLSDFDEIPIVEFMEYVNENDFKYYSIMGLVDEQTDFFYKDGETLIRADRTGLDESMIGAIERFLDDRTGEDDFVVVSGITDWASLPAANAEWNGWLLYSAVRAWSGKYRTMTTSNKLKIAVPIIVKAEVPATTPEGLVDYEVEKLDMNGFEKLIWMEEKGLL